MPTSETNPAKVVTVLSVSPHAEDHFTLQAIFSHSRRAFYKADCLASALAALRRWEIGVVLCERNLSPGSWLDMLEEMGPLPNAPPLIVTSRLADEHLWAEALNRGAYDVLAKPFEIKELVRSVNSAWLHWHHRQEIQTRAWSTLPAAS